MGADLHARTRYKAGEENTKVQKRGEEEPGREPRQGNRRSWIKHIPHSHRPVRVQKSIISWFKTKSLAGKTNI